MPKGSLRTSLGPKGTNDSLTEVVSSILLGWLSMRVVFSPLPKLSPILKFNSQLIPVLVSPSLVFFWVWCHYYTKWTSDADVTEVQAAQ